MKRITIENCESLEGKRFKYIYADGTTKTVEVAIIDKHIGMTCMICDGSGDTTGEEAMCFDFRKQDKYNTRASFLSVANDIERGVFRAEKWMTTFVEDYNPFGSSLSDCAFI
jgi:hypothetical protein